MDEEDEEGWLISKREEIWPGESRVAWDEKTKGRWAVVKVGWGANCPAIDKDSRRDEFPTRNRLRER